MKPSAKGLQPQMNLPLLTAQHPPVLSGDQHKELTLTLVELLINAAHKTFDVPSHGGDNDPSETHV